MNARGQYLWQEIGVRSLKNVPAGPREENPVALDTEEEEILEEQDAAPLCIRIPGALTSSSRKSGSD